MIFDVSADGRALRVEVRGGEGRYTVVLDGRPLEVEAAETSRSFLSLLVEGRSYDVGLEPIPSGFRVSLPDDTLEVTLTEAARGAASAVRKAPTGPARVSAPMPGKIVRLLVGDGDDVEAGQGLLVMEAMKMENEIRAPRAGRVRAVAVREAQTVETGALLAVVE